MKSKLLTSFFSVWFFALAFNLFAQQKSLVLNDAGIYTNFDSINQSYQTAHFGPSVPSVNACPSTNSLLAPYNQNNGQRGIMFDVTAITCVTIRCFESNFATGTTGVQIWYRPGTHVGFANSSIGWTLLGTANAVVGAGVNIPTAIPIPINITINAGATAAFYITRTTAGGPLVQYTNGTALGAVYASDANLQVKDGTGKDFSFGASFTPRRFNGRIFYDVGTTAVPVGPVSGPTPVCAGTSQTFSVAPVTGATGYAWTVPAGSSITSGNNTNSITVTMGSTSGNVCVTPVVPCGIVTPSCFSVTINSNITVAASALPSAVCAGTTSQLTVSGATTYTWTPSTGLSCVNCANPIATPTVTTTYSVTGNASGCIGNATTTVTVLPNPAPLATNTGPYCQGSTITLNAGGGTSYSWSGPSSFASTQQNPTLNSATTNMSGVYTVTATIGTCTASTTTSVTVNPLPNVTVNSTSICLGQSTATLTASGALNYQWSSGTSSPTGTTVTAGPLTTTVYTVTGTDANNCSDTGIATVVVNPLPPVAVNSPSVCPGSTATLIASGATSYTWSSGTSSPTGSSVTASPATTTNYTVTGTDNNSCTNTAIATVTIFNSLVVDAGVNDTVCVGSNISLNATGPLGTTYTWNPGNFSGAIQSIPSTATTTFTLSAVDINGCTGSDSITITVPPAVTLTMGGFSTLCNGSCNGQVVVIPSPSTGSFAQYNYLWSNGAVTPSVLNVCAGNYTVTVTDAAGCNVSDTVSVNQPTAVTASAGNFIPASCNGSCDGGTTISANGGTGNYNFAWSSLGTGSTPTNLCAGNYTCTVSDANGCSVPVSVSITEPAAISVVIPGVSPICIGQNVSLSANASGGNGGYTYTWTGITSSAQSVSVSPIVTSSYSVSVSDVNGCAAGTATVSISVAPPLSVVANGSVPSLCAGGSLSMNASASGGNGTYTYSWTGGTVPTSGTTVGATPNGTTTYTVTVNDGCSTPAASATVQVIVNPLPTLSISTSEPSGCAPLCVQFTAASNPPAASVNWVSSNGQTATGVGPANFCFTAQGTYGAGISVTDVNGCQNSFTNNALVTVYPVPSAAFSYSPTAISDLNPIVNFTDETSGATPGNWSWNFGNGQTSTAQNPIIDFGNAGEYTVNLVVVSDNGCADSTSNQIVITSDFSIYIPNAFTPNGDGFNDVFFPTGTGIENENYELSIYNRWGTKIWSTNDLLKGWDGKVEGGSEVVQQDVYVWRIYLKKFDGTKKNYTGHVTVIR
jgi:gliding motility-associated-like protein